MRCTGLIQHIHAIMCLVEDSIRNAHGMTFFLSRLPSPNCGVLVITLTLASKWKKYDLGRFALNCGRRWEMVLDKRTSAEH